jgi:(p)ppGpp synthase/HD superfamily hydrolase
VISAEDIARQAHEGQTDKLGQPYIGHVSRVARAAVAIGREHAPDIDSSLVESTAWLHDVLEDSSTTANDLRTYGFAEDVIGAVEALTKLDGEEYGDAIRRAASHPIARWVKIADNLDNSNEQRLVQLDEVVATRLRSKYADARVILNWPSSV